MKVYSFILFLALSLIFMNCKNGVTETDLAQEVIDQSLEASKTNKLANAEISFTFRDKKYRAERNAGKYVLNRIITTNDTTIIDRLDNESFRRELNGAIVHLDNKKSMAYSESVNSVHYFSVLPYGLNDAAVHKKYIGEESIKGKLYHKIQITFSEDGGGTDHDDVFFYWFDKDSYLLDYLAYSYHTNGGGMRFRALKEEKLVNGIRLADYHNYKPIEDNLELTDIAKAYNNDQLKKLSEIILEDIDIRVP